MSEGNLFIYFIGICLVITICNCLYGTIKYCCKRRGENVHPIQNLHDEFVEIENANEQLNNLSNIETYTQTGIYDSDVKKECVICLENINKKQLIRTLNCFHIYHKNCIDEWLVKKFKCPICCKDITNYQQV